LVFADPGAVVYDWGSDDTVIDATNLDGLDPVNPAAGTYTLEYTSPQDSDGNQATATRTVGAELCEIATLYAFETNSFMDWILLEISGTGWTVTDSPGGEPLFSGTVVEFDNGSNELIVTEDTGEYSKFAWTDPDLDGHTTMTQFIGYQTLEDVRAATTGDIDLDGYTIETNVPPVLILIGDDPVMVEVGGDFVDEGAQVKDWDDAEPIVYADSSGLDTSVEGTYTITYSYGPDSDGNVATQITRTVAVGSGTAEIIIQ
jgi:hypothetical protein